MRTRLIVATALLAVGATASPASADKPEPIDTPEAAHVDLCGGITVEVIKNNVKANSEGDESGFTERLRGNFVLRITSDDGPSIVVRAPGRVHVVGTEQTVTVQSIGRTLLLPPDEVGVAAHVEAGLPEVALVTGRVVITSMRGEDGMSIDDDITWTGHVVDVCELLGQ